MNFLWHRPWAARLAAWMVLAGFVATIHACQTPVFRYALERWKPSVYPLLIFHRGPLTPEQEQAVAALRQLGETQKLANVAVRLVEVSSSLPAGVETVWKAQTNATLPWVVLRYPDTEPESPDAWAGPLTPRHLEKLVDSPLRRAVVRGLAAGHAVVWMLLESGNRAADDRAAALLEQELKTAQRRIELTPDPDAPDQTNLTLEVSFQLLRSPRQAPEEELFLHTMLSVEPQLAARETPIVVPIFGRGRALCALPESQITPKVMREMLEFLTGACSCEVKEMNPGLDLLMTANWEEVAGAKRYSEPPPASLVGLGSLVEKTNAPPSPPAPPAVAATPPPAAPTSASPLVQNLWIFGASLAAILGLATWWVTRRAN
ncbi:hypothetical protein NXS98_16855 [Fontisphaera persica]|uniref:hypothetical protein n=1 Tax=Fontisphaera persica TaxID=2974023 RepID=UPI0024C01242|nr:hypothetical protein [Fontisphaera persica]WCJ59366.1 hypothetical protein NXS98_16855 [Fontisphaera persica]